MADTFDPNGVGLKGALFGLPFNPDAADIVVIPVPWDVTVSYAEGTALAPQQILEASSQIDYEMPGRSKLYQTKVALSEIPEMWLSKDEDLRPIAAEYIDWLEEGQNPEEAEAMEEQRIRINAECAQLMDYVEQESLDWQVRGKKTILLGGDHSTPLGHIRACAAAYPQFGLLQIDAHADLREAYEGFTYSHASIMHNVLQEQKGVKLVQVGIRDYCEEERLKMEAQPERITTFFDDDLKKERFEGVTWQEQCDHIVNALPEFVYISVDIDGLDPKLCPSTGTPVPGGLDFHELAYLLNKLKASGKQVIGADLCEVGVNTSDWDANVGARVLWQLVHCF